MPKSCQTVRPITSGMSRLRVPTSKTPAISKLRAATETHQAQGLRITKATVAIR